MGISRYNRFTALQRLNRDQTLEHILELGNVWSRWLDSSVSAESVNVYKL